MLGDCGLEAERLLAYREMRGRSSIEAGLAFAAIAMSKLHSQARRDEMDAKNTTSRHGQAAPVTKHTGIRHLFAAASYSLGGAKRLIGEAAFRHELIAFAVAMAAFIIADASLFQYVAMAILFLLMMAFEAINTAIEEIVDRVSPEISDMGKHAKDLGSFACLCLILANATYAFYVVFLARYLG